MNTTPGINLRPIWKFIPTFIVAAIYRKNTRLEAAYTGGDVDYYDKVADRATGAYFTLRARGIEA